VTFRRLEEGREGTPLNCRQMTPRILEQKPERFLKSRPPGLDASSGEHRGENDKLNLSKLFHYFNSLNNLSTVNRFRQEIYLLYVYISLLFFFCWCFIKTLLHLLVQYSFAKILLNMSCVGGMHYLTIVYLEFYII
jgi:hypothetical protein